MDDFEVTITIKQKSTGEEHTYTLPSVPFLKDFTATIQRTFGSDE